MIDVKNISVVDLLPHNFKDDETVKNIALSIDSVFNKMTEKTKKLSMYERLYKGELTSEEIDMLAWQNHVDFYDASLPLSQRLELVRKSISFHRIKGTASSIENLIKILFGDGEVEEYWQYGGEPGYFQVVTNNQSVTNEKAQEFIRALRTVKRASQHLDTVLISQIQNKTLYTASYVHVGEKITIKGKR